MPMTVQGPASTTVTGTWLPSSPNTWVIPTLRPINPSLRAMTISSFLQDDQKGPDARRRGRPTEAYAAYAAGRADRANEADGPFSSELDFHVDAGWEVQLHQR